VLRLTPGDRAVGLDGEGHAWPLVALGGGGRTGRAPLAFADPLLDLEDRFTAGDLLMTTVLRILRHTDLVSAYPALDAYVQRCEARPAWTKVVAEHHQRLAA